MRRHVTWQKPRNSFNNTSVGGGRQLEATDIDLTRTNEWQPNHRQEDCEEKLSNTCREMMCDLTPADFKYHETSQTER